MSSLDKNTHLQLCSRAGRGNFPLILAFISALFLFTACDSISDKNSSQNLTDPNVWMMQDVSVLFPKPTTLPNPNAIKAANTANGGTFIPDSLIQKLPLLEPHLSTATQGSQLELVGVRFDPPEVRLVWQIYKPIIDMNGQPQIVAFDTAVHVFYQVPNTDAFKDELKSVNALARADLSTSTPLGVHPTLLNRGWNSEYGKSLKAFIAKWCGEQNLFKMTFMAATGEHLRWEFGGFNYAQGSITPLLIPKINVSGIQKFINSSPSADAFQGGIDILPSGQNEFNDVISDSANLSSISQDKLERAHFTSVTLENPQLAPTDQTDCASCHVAQMVKRWTESRVSGLNNNTQNLFTGTRYNLSNPSADQNRSDNLRSFGYFAGNPSVSQRLINETALVADRLSK